jgi:hypothetical protein
MGDVAKYTQVLSSESGATSECASLQAGFSGTIRPRLPVPILSDTLERYLESIKPFLLENARKGGERYEDALQRYVDLLGSFETGMGQRLQERLLG